MIDRETLKKIIYEWNREVVFAEKEQTPEQRKKTQKIKRYIRRGVGIAGAVTLGTIGVKKLLGKPIATGTKYVASKTGPKLKFHYTTVTGPGLPD
jgi:hypothetical protein